MHIRAFVYTNKLFTTFTSPVKTLCKCKNSRRGKCHLLFCSSLFSDALRKLCDSGIYFCWHVLRNICIATSLHSIVSHAYIYSEALIVWTVSYHMRTFTVKTWLFEQLTNYWTVSPPWTNNVILLKKKDGATRFVIYYHQLNELIIKDSYPMLYVSEIMDKMQAGVTLLQFKLDMAPAYWAKPN